MKRTVMLMPILACFLAACETQERPHKGLLSEVNILRNASFDNGVGVAPSSWKTANNIGEGVTFTWEERGRRGGRCVSIENKNEQSEKWASWTQGIEVEGGAPYVIRGFVKTKDFRGTVSVGAHFYDANRKKVAIKGAGGFSEADCDWTKVEGRVVAPGSARFATFHCGIKLTGKVCFDDAVFGKCSGMTKSGLAETRVYPCLPLSPKIDGKLDDWKDVPSITLSSAVKVSPAAAVVITPPDWKGPDDLSGSICLSYDQEALYAAGEVKDDNLGSVIPRPIWRGDGIQFGFDTRQTPSKGFDDDDVICAMAAAEKGFYGAALRVPTSVKKKEELQLIVLPTEGGYRFEMAIPWRNFGDFKPMPNGKMGFNVILTDEDGSGQQWAEWMSGMKWQIDTSSWGILLLVPPDHFTGCVLLPRGEEFDNVTGAAVGLDTVRVSEEQARVRAEVTLQKDGQVTLQLAKELSVEKGHNIDEMIFDTTSLEPGSYDLTASVRTPAGEELCRDEVQLSLYGLREFLSGVEQQIASVKRDMARLQKCISQADARGIETIYARCTLTVAELFVDFAREDAQHKEYRKLALDELAYLPRALEKATAELQSWIQNPGKSLAVSPVSLAELRIRDGQFHIAEGPTFLGGFNFGSRAAMEGMLEEMKTLGLNVLGTAMSPARYLKGEGEFDGTPLERDVLPVLDMAKREGTVLDVLLGHHMPAWAMEKFPELDQGWGHFCSYDIDHPVVRKIWREALSKTVPEIAKCPVMRLYDLANEPEFPRYSALTVEKWRTWLKETYRTIARLNEMWGMELRDFSEIAEPPKNNDNHAIWYDWCVFNQHRVTDFFKFLRDEIKHHDSDAKIHIKVSNGVTFWGSRTVTGIGEVTISRHRNGMDRQALMALMDVNGCDTRIVHGLTDYAINWLNQNMAFDFQRSVAPDKPVFDSEWHSVDTVFYREANIPYSHMEVALWLAHLHGMSGNTIWHWSREGVAPRGKWFGESLLTQPALLEAYGRTIWHLRRLAPYVTAFVRQKRPVRLLYSEASAIQDVKYLDALQDVYEGLNFLGVPIGFVTERQLRTEGLDGCKILILANPQYVLDETVKRLQKWDGKIVMVGSKSLRHDQHGKPRGPLDIEAKLLEDGLEPTEYARKLDQIIESAGVRGKISVLDPDGNRPWGLEWRTAGLDTKTILYLINLTKGPLRVQVKGLGGNSHLTNLVNSQSMAADSIEAVPLSPILAECPSGRE